ncbi:MAG TPA: SAM-dependent methyltransferase [Verrucomicrobiales bacterium]|nr:SAM-dependent methyltransferase [Verrucomicrobiales bacterium]
MDCITSRYLFALTNAGSEKALKLEAESMKTGWRPGYQRRGFVTFKAESDDRPFSLSGLNATAPACARRLCLSLGKTSALDAAIQLLGNPSVIHHTRLTGGRLERVSARGEPHDGEIAGTIVELSPDEFWTGVHLHGPFVSPDPGGYSILTLPENAPSRAWLKLEEAVRFFGLRFTSRDVAVELGCAPGGVILALLNRGVSAIGVDPAKLAPVVMAAAAPSVQDAPRDRPWVFHCRKPAALVSKRDLGTNVTWFMSDMNQSPSVALSECARFIKMCPAIRSALITLKLTDLSQVVEKENWFQALRNMGFHTTYLQQFSVHNRELALLAQGR